MCGGVGGYYEEGGSCGEAEGLWEGGGLVWDEDVGGCY